MSSVKKIKISVTINSRILRKIDRYVKTHQGYTRSSVVEAWLEKSSRKMDEEKLNRDTLAYYESLTPEAVKDDDEWAEQSTKAAKSLKFD